MSICRHPFDLFVHIYTLKLFPTIPKVQVRYEHMKPTDPTVDDLRSTLRIDTITFTLGRVLSSSPLV